MKYLIGIDSGGTKSELIAYDLEGHILYKKIGDYGNPAVDLDTTIENISDLIFHCLNTLINYECIFIAIGIAGVDVGNYKEFIKGRIYDRFLIKNSILNDATIAAKAYLGNEDGILAIAGTGSSCYVQRGNIGEVIGGWGHILGDEGSGYHTVIEAFKNITLKIDKGLPFDNLSKFLMKEINATNSSDIKMYIYGNKKGTIASLFSKIVQLSKEGDTTATKLLQNAGEYLAEMTINAYRKYKFNNKIIIGLKGGVFHHSEVVFKSYEKSISKYIKDYTFIKEDMSSTKAVYNIYKLRR